MNHHLEREYHTNEGLKCRIWEENKKIWRVGFPAMLARTTQYGMLVVTQAFIGHIGKVDLAGYALIQIIAIGIAIGILLGMSSATETLCGQAFGAKQYHMMGIYLQRSCIINLVAGTLLVPLFIFSAKIFKLLGQDEEIPEKAGYICLWIVGWLSAASFALHVILSWIFVSKLNWGIPGAMSALIVSSWSIIIGTMIYITCGWCPNTWNGFSLAAFSDLVPVIKLSISSGIMICLEFWYTAILVLVAGYMKNAATQVSALSICVNITDWEFLLCIGFLASASVRVSNELGRGDAKAVIFAIKVLIAESTCVGMLFFILFLALDRQIAGLVTNDANVIEAVSKLSVPLAFSVLLNSFQTVFTGVAVGAGRQKIVAYINICSYYIIGVPIGVILGYVAHLQITGIWIGMVIGVIMQVMALGYMIFATNWDEQVKRASERLNRWSLKASDESNNIILPLEKIEIK
ncbi:protein DETOXIFICATION 24-like isoform X2 [Mercurialis annua]|uniref:protein DETOXIFICATION 24-like isoform X2 n=1 Tax=Mercurialis annua TaxID=3986 RepID=UPI00215E1527|nr:protein DETOXIFICATION 24-like isoform X2 [Mercurialis annua]